jgi:S-DNA-T family DNA segregation ATPase FtsK/SpoIIIE
MTRRTTSQRSKSKSPTKRRRRGKSQSPPPERPRISLDRQLDILGIVLVALAGITLLSFLSATRGSLTEGWVNLLSRIFGLGVYLVPFGMGLAGLWLILRSFERRPTIGGERTAGAVVLYLSSLALLHLLSFAEDPKRLAEAGGGGGHLGYYLSQWLLTNLGGWGTGVALLAALLIATVLLANFSIAELGTLLHMVGQALLRLLAKLRLPRLRWLGRQRAEGRSLFTPPLTQGAAEVYDDRPLRVSPVTEHDPLTGRIIGDQQEWPLPHLGEILEDAVEQEISQAEIRKRARIIEETLHSFGVPVKVMEVNQGPVVTQFGVEPGFVEGRGGRRTKVKVSKIVTLADDLALALAASPVRVEAPVPGRSIVGIEVPNADVSLVSLCGVMESEAFQKIDSQLRIALGRDVSGQAVAADLGIMPHLLIAGATGSGKSVCVNSIISCLLMNNTPADLRLLMVDPKRVELTGYDGIPHLLAPVIVELDKVVRALQWVTREMDARYWRFAQAGARNIDDHNQRAETPSERLPYIVVLIDELADLMITSPDETERTITRLAQMARATGIHLVIATQRPSVDVVTGLIKANFPSRVAFAVTSSVDSRVILDTPGAERLLGRGDMLYMASDSSELRRLQGCFVSDREINRLVNYWKSAGPAPISATLPVALRQPPRTTQRPVQRPLWEEMRQREREAAQSDVLLDQAIALVQQHNQASVSLLQRKLRIGYARAGRLMDLMEQRGVVGPSEGPGRARRVLSPKGRTKTDRRWS